jgi:hypothetical protein
VKFARRSRKRFARGPSNLVSRSRIAIAARGDWDRSGVHHDEGTTREEEIP